MYKPQKRLHLVVAKKPIETKPKTKAQGSKLPSDTYQDLISPKMTKVKSFATDKSCGVTYISCAVKRFGDEGLPYLDVRQYEDKRYEVRGEQKSFKGFTDKGVIIPIEYAYEFAKNLLEVIGQEKAVKLANEIIYGNIPDNEAPIYGDVALEAHIKGLIVDTKKSE